MFVPDTGTVEVLIQLDWTQVRGKVVDQYVQVWTTADPSQPQHTKVVPQEGCVGHKRNILHQQRDTKVGG
jgi:hypothetical protein